MKQLKTIIQFVTLIFLMSYTTCALSLPASVRVINVINTIPSEEQKCMLIDKQGKLWMGSIFGLKSYDGYRFSSYRSDVKSPNILPSNNVLSLAEGKDDCLWIGTNNGLVRMDMRKGGFTNIKLNNKQKIVYSLFVSKSGTLWMGTNDGLARYIDDQQGFYRYTGANTIVIHKDGRKHPLYNISVKSFAEDKNGQIYIGTWEDDLYRLDPKRNVLYDYDLWDKKKKVSAYSMQLDQKGQLWIGTWGHGLKCLTHPRNIKNPGLLDIPNEKLGQAIIYKEVEDRKTRTIWFCTREGIGIADIDAPQKGAMLYPEIGKYKKYTTKAIADICADQQGNIWAASRFNGIYHINTQPSPFILNALPNLKPEMMGINSIMTTDGSHFWLSFSPCGIGLYDRNNNTLLLDEQIPGMASLPYLILHTHIPTIIQRHHGETWLANNSHGVIIWKDGKTVLKDKTNCDFIKDNYVNTFFESRNKTFFIGENNYLDYILPSGQAFNLFLDTNVMGITEDNKGNIWVSTSNKGILCLKGNLRYPSGLEYKWYNTSNQKLVINETTSCYFDSRQRLWVISNSGGLLRYDQQEDRFVSVNDEYHWDFDRFLSITEDAKGNLWLTGDKALVCLSTLSNGETTHTIFTSEDGLGNILFAPYSSFRYGNELFLGSGRNLISFSPTTALQSTGNLGSGNNTRIIITDLLIDNKRYIELDSTLRSKLSNATPSYMHELTIPASIDKFALEFALLSYINSDQCKYAYFLEGYDKEWHYVDASLRQASFENIPSGTYKLHVKAADSFGRWNEMPYIIRIKVLPPWYASWWAYLIYIGLLLVGMRVAIIWYRNRLRTKNRLQMAVVFTNITHELLTPLTVISAAADSIKRIAPATDSQTSIIHDNINRLTRMLRQILEVRKSQAGKLQLKVSEGKLGNFCAETTASLMPMFTTKNLSFKQDITCMDEKAWFDTDKVEKMLYNLLNNAVKYTEEGGKVSLSVSIAEKQATLIVSDTGIGISKDKMKHLYDRFLDGDYRQMNTIGTGIGLSLVNDLVKLHHGKIKCESEEGKGTTFTITFPINKENYSEEEILQEEAQSVENLIITTSKSEEAMATSQANNTFSPDIVDINAENADADSYPKEGEKEHTILLVEDNNELLTLMSSLLCTHYNVLTASNGEKAQKVIQKASLDVVVTDLMMPVMDGIELTKWIKENENYSQLPVVMLTAKTQDTDRNEGYKAGADAYLTKPFKLEDLKLRIDSIIANRQRIRQRFQSQTDFKVEDQHYSSPDELFLQSCIEKVKAHLDDSDFGREQLAADLCISSSTLYYKLRALTGQNITSFINSIRLKEACQILKREPGIRINELTYRVGFNTPRYFSLCFKKEYGISVKEYVEQNNKTEKE